MENVENSLETSNQSLNQENVSYTFNTQSNHQSFANVNCAAQNNMNLLSTMKSRMSNINNSTFTS